MKKLLIASLALAFLVGCQDKPLKVNQELRHQIFMACLASSPQDSLSTDWADVVKKCDDVAYSQALEY